MSVASSVINSAYPGTPWVEGQNPVGTNFDVAIPTQTIATGAVFSIDLDLAEGVWAITPDCEVTSQEDGTVISDVFFTLILTGGAVAYNSTVYLNRTLDDGDNIFASNSFIVVVNTTTNTSPVTAEVSLTYVTAGTDMQLVGTITVIRIA
jgi:hypothetical protein